MSDLAEFDIGNIEDRLRHGGSFELISGCGAVMTP
jgi:hypothetical protein